MNPNTPPRPDLVPTSSRPAGRPQKSTSSLVPLPYGGRGRTGVQTTHQQNPTQVVPGTRSNTTNPNDCDDHDCGVFPWTCKCCEYGNCSNPKDGAR